MKQLCMINYVWGEYQQYIPIYLLFLGISYPEYDARIYLDSALEENVKNQLEVVSKVYQNYTIIEKFKADKYFSEQAQKHSQVMKCLRWLHYEKEFEKYEALYIGDIDILIGKEELTIFESHKEHCKIINRAYSNVCRPIRKKNRKLGYLYQLQKNYGFRNMMEYLFKDTRKEIRFSGLHFILTQEYYEKVLPVIEFFCKEINRMADNKKSIFNICSFNNEMLLRKLVIEAELGDSFLIGEDEEHLDKGYRPHHGLHIGRYRGNKLPADEDLYIKSHKMFYEQYEEVKQLEVYREMEQYFPPYLKDILKKMENVYTNA